MIIWTHFGQCTNSRRERGGCELIDGNAAARLTTGAVRQWLGGLHAPGDGRAEPLLAAPAIAEGARDKGARSPYRLSGAGHRHVRRPRSAVEMSRRGRIDCDAVVIAAGAWSTKLCRQARLPLPAIDRQRNSVPDGAGQRRTGRVRYARKPIRSGVVSTAATRSAAVAKSAPSSRPTAFVSSVILSRSARLWLDDPTAPDRPCLVGLEDIAWRGAVVPHAGSASGRGPLPLRLWRSRPPWPLLASISSSAGQAA